MIMIMAIIYIFFIYFLFLHVIFDSSRNFIAENPQAHLKKSAAPFYSLSLPKNLKIAIPAFLLTLSIF